MPDMGATAEMMDSEGENGRILIEKQVFFCMFLAFSSIIHVPCECLQQFILFAFFAVVT